MIDKDSIIPQTSTKSLPAPIKREGNNQFGSKGTLICEECRRRKKLCDFVTVDQCCKFCAGKGLSCGPKYTRQELRRRSEEGEAVNFGQHATLRVEYFLRDMKVDEPIRKDEDLLDALQGAIEQKRRQLKMKRGRQGIDSADPEDELAAKHISSITPGAKKPRVESDFSDETNREAEMKAQKSKGEVSSSSPPVQRDVTPAPEPSTFYIQIDKEEGSTQAMVQTAQTIENAEDFDWGSFVNEIFRVDMPIWEEPRRN